VYVSWHGFFPCDEQVLFVPLLLQQTLGDIQSVVEDNTPLVQALLNTQSPPKPLQLVGALVGAVGDLQQY
jgi:hypothetical protein